MTYAVYLSPRAQRDFANLLRHTRETVGADQLPRDRNKIDGALQSLSVHPRLGHTRDELPDSYLVWPVGQHILVYRVVPGKVEVARILHRRMDLSRHI